MSLDDDIKDSLREFLEAINSNRWRGREREAISYFALGFLGRRIEPTRMAIEAAVQQIGAPHAKEHVCKDLVIWPKAAMTFWWPPRHGNDPDAILEWKVSRADACTPPSERDCRWLDQFAATCPTFVGYAAHLDLAGEHARLRVERTGHAGPEPWLEA